MIGGYKMRKNGQTKDEVAGLKRKLNDSVIKNVIQLLNSSKRNMMDKCYKCIRESNENRQLPEKMSKDEFFIKIPLISAVITTANKIECDTLNYAISKQDGGDAKKVDNGLDLFGGCSLNPEVYLLKFQSRYFLHLRAQETGSNTPGGSTDLIRLVFSIPNLFPSYIISFGICYGIHPKKQKIGDVIIPEKLYPWSIGQKIGEDDWSIKNDNFNLWLADKCSDKRMYAEINDFCNGADGKNFELTFDFLYDKKDLMHESYHITYGNMNTGEAVVSSKTAKKRIVSATKIIDGLAGEMEGYGIAKECIYYSNTPFFIIKSICDWGDKKNIEQILIDYYMQGKSLKEQNDNKCPSEIKDYLPKKPIPSHLKDRLQAYAAFCAADSLIKLLTEKKECFLTFEFFKQLQEKGLSFFSKIELIDEIQQFYPQSEPNGIFRLLVDEKYIIPTSNLDKFRIAE